MQTKRDANQGGRLGQHLQRNASKGKYKAAGKCKAGRCQASGRCKSKGSAHDSTCKELQAKGFEKLQGKQHREMLRLREMKIKGIAQTVLTRLTLLFLPLKHVVWRTSAYWHDIVLSCLRIELTLNLFPLGTWHL
eukprot:1159744-Pelagomonas_calceolata.AAC.4